MNIEGKDFLHILSMLAIVVSGRMVSAYNKIREELALMRENCARQFHPGEEYIEKRITEKAQHTQDVLCAEIRLLKQQIETMSTCLTGIKEHQEQSKKWGKHFLEKHNGISLALSELLKEKNPTLSKKIIE